MPGGNRRGLLWSDPRVKPPYGSVEIDDSPWNGVWLFNEAAGNPFNLVNRFAAVPTGLFADWTVNVRGLAERRLNSATWQLGTEGSTLKLPTTYCTLLVVRRKTDTTLRAVSHIANSASFNLHCPYSDGIVYWDFGGNGAPNRLTWGGYSVSTNVEFWAFVAGTRGSSIFFNGELKATQATTISRSAGSASTSVGGDFMELTQIAILEEEWTAGQVAEWYANPYVFLRSTIWRRYFVPAAAAGGIPSLVGPRFGLAGRRGLAA